MEIAKKILDYTLKIICACALFFLVYLCCCGTYKKSGGRYEFREVGMGLIKIDKITGETYEYRVQGREHTDDSGKDGTYFDDYGNKTYNDSIPKWYKMNDGIEYY